MKFIQIFVSVIFIFKKFCVSFDTYPTSCFRLQWKWTNQNVLYAVYALFSEFLLFKLTSLAFIFVGKQ